MFDIIGLTVLTKSNLQFSSNIYFQKSRHLSTKCILKEGICAQYLYPKLLMIKRYSSKKHFQEFNLFFTSKKKKGGKCLHYNQIIKIMERILYSNKIVKV